VVEGARLESVCRGNSTVGSNPTLSANLKSTTLIGDDEKTVREHYARWVPERQARLTKILKETFHAKPKLTAITGGRA
jgi:hypothetical protein